MKCPSCGVAVEDGADLCLECGEPMGDSPAAKAARAENVIRPPAATFTTRPASAAPTKPAVGAPTKPGAAPPPSAPKSQTEILPELKQVLEAKPANGYQVILPVVKGLQPGADNEVCTWTELVFDHDVDIRAVQAFQTTGGHHVVLYTTTKLQEPG